MARWANRLHRASKVMAKHLRGAHRLVTTSFTRSRMVGNTARLHEAISRTKPAGIRPVYVSLILHIVHVVRGGGVIFIYGRGLEDTTSKKREEVHVSL